jgi:hypothetical protein
MPPTSKRVQLCRPARRGHRQYRSRRPRLCAAGGQRAGQPGREPPAAPDRRRAGPPRPSTTRGRPGRRVSARADQPDPDHARTPQDLHLGPSRAGLPAYPQAPGPLPHRLRGADQPPQAWLWAASVAMGCGAAACEASKASGSKPAVRSWPTTSTPSPSRPPDPVHHQTAPASPRPPLAIRRSCTRHLSGASN